MIWLRCRNSWVTQCGDTPNYSGGGYLSPMSSTFKDYLEPELETGPLTPLISCIYLLYPPQVQMMSSKTLYFISVWHLHHPFKANISVINWNPLHPQDITTWCSDDIMTCFGRKVYACTWLTEQKESLWAQKQMLQLSPSYKGRNGSPRHTLWHIYHILPTFSALMKD